VTAAQEKSKAVGLLLALALAAPARAAEPVPALQAAAAHQIETTEQGFAQTVSQLGLGSGFRKYAAPGAIIFSPDPTPAGYYPQIARPAGEMVRRPLFVGVAPSGDLAFSLGASADKQVGKAGSGLYITLWKHGADGGWQFVLDRVAETAAPPLEGLSPPPVILGIDPMAKPDLAQGLREADVGLDMDLSRDNPDAFASRLDDQAVVVRANRSPASTKRRVLKLLASSPSITDARLLSAALSADGVLGYTYGKARWMTGAGPQQGYYVRVWRNVGQGWRLLVDHLAER
jgi:ketosteroid isomerase-like protein